MLLSFLGYKKITFMFLLGFCSLQKKINLCSFWFYQNLKTWTPCFQLFRLQKKIAFPCFLRFLTWKKKSNPYCIFWAFGAYKKLHACFCSIYTLQPKNTFVVFVLFQLIGKSKSLCFLVFVATCQKNQIHVSWAFLACKKIDSHVFDRY